MNPQFPGSQGQMPPTGFGQPPAGPGQRPQGPPPNMYNGPNQQVQPGPSMYYQVVKMAHVC